MAKRRALTEAQEARLVADYQGGVTTRDLAARFHVSAATVCSVVVRHVGYSTGRRGGPRTPRAKGGEHG